MSDERLRQIYQEHTERKRELAAFYFKGCLREERDFQRRLRQAKLLRVDWRAGVILGMLAAEAEIVKIMHWDEIEYEINFEGRERTYFGYQRREQKLTDLLYRLVHDKLATWVDDPDSDSYQLLELTDYGREMVEAMNGRQGHPDRDGEGPAAAAGRGEGSL